MYVYGNFISNIIPHLLFEGNHNELKYKFNNKVVVFVYVQDIIRGSNNLSTTFVYKKSIIFSKYYWENLKYY